MSALNVDRTSTFLFEHRPVGAPEHDDAASVSHCSNSCDRFLHACHFGRDLEFAQHADPMTGVHEGLRIACL